MTSALIGHTGFVGSALYRAGKFDAAVNSTTISSIAGASFDTIICAGARSVKWKANANPEADNAEFKALITSLKTLKAREFILISTIDVYPQPSYGRWADESETLSILDHNQAYGKNRLYFEFWIQDTFPLVRIIRLPALFGEGLKKNVLFDLMNHRSHEKVKLNPDSTFQWYPLRWLWGDLQAIREGDLRLINLFPEPITTSRILSAFFPHVEVDPNQAPLVRYNINTKYWNSFYFPAFGYRMHDLAIMAEMARFLCRN